MEALKPASSSSWNAAFDSDNSLAGIFPDLRPSLTAEQAVAEANRCLECGGKFAAAPCVQACPAHVQVPQFIGALARGDSRRAAEIIFEENILGASCSRVCPVEQFCEGACVLTREGRRPVEIGRLQRFAAERELRKGGSFRWAQKANGKKVSVIGGGPAGLSCAAELALRGYKVTVYDKNEDHGGLVRYAIAPYRIRRDPIPDEVEMIASLGVDFRLGSDIDSREKLEAIANDSDAVFLGIGLAHDISLSHQGEKLPGVWSSLDFIRAIKTGHPPTVGPRVAVVGGGNTAIDVAREALRLGGKEVTLYYRRTEAHMPAYPHEIEEARNEGVRFQVLTDLVGFQGTDHLEALELQYMKLDEPDGSGRPRPVRVPGTEFRVPCETAIMAVGQERRTGFLEWIEGITLESGLIRIDQTTGQTTNPKFFAGGDSLNGGATAVEAVQNGKTAADGIDAYLREARA